MLIAFIVAGGSETGTITGIITRKDGFSYLVGDGTTERAEEIQEKNVLNAYRPVKARATRKTTKAKASKPVTKKQQQENSLVQ